MAMRKAFPDSSMGGRRASGNMQMESMQVAIRQLARTLIHWSNDTQFPLPQRETANFALFCPSEGVHNLRHVVQWSLQSSFIDSVIHSGLAEVRVVL